MNPLRYAMAHLLGMTLVCAMVCALALGLTVLVRHWHLFG
ncbi:hypothetical protein PSP31120_01730 [Pandoraea sputorum]|nr:hypothetical protein PSP31120_01730 [Pandoraea sputorum]